MDTLGAVHISSALDKYENARTGFFTFVIEDFEDLVRSDFDLEQPTENDIIRNGQEVIELAVMKSSIPHFNVAVNKIRIGNSEIKYAGVPEFPSGSIVCQDYVGLDTKSVLMAWQALVYDVVNDRGGRAGDWVDENGIEHKGYKRNCVLTEYTQDKKEIRHWDLIGCFPQELREDDFDKENDGTRQITVAIEYDRAIMHMPD